MFNHLKKNRNSSDNLYNSAELPASGVVGSGALASQNNNVIQHNTIENAPIIQETVRNDRIIEVQPVVHRSVDKNVVHHIEKHIQEPAPATMAGTIERSAIIQQEMHTNVVNEVQPIIHRERVVPVTEVTERHFSERVTGPTVHTHEVIYEQGMGYQQQGMGYQQQGLGYQQQGLGLQQQAQSSQYLQTAQPTINQQPIGVLEQTQSIPLYAPPMGIPYGTVGDTTTGAKVGKRHHHGVLHRNAH